MQTKRIASSGYKIVASWEELGIWKGTQVVCRGEALLVSFVCVFDNCLFFGPIALQSRDPQWYAAMMNPLTKEQNNELQQVFTIADQRTAAAGELRTGNVVRICSEMLTI